MFKRKCCLPQCDNYFMVLNRKAYRHVLVKHIRIGWRFLRYPITVRIGDREFRGVGRRLMCPLHPKIASV